MKKLLLILPLLFTFALSKGIKISPISAPESVFLDIDIDNCNDLCLKNFLRDYKIFSFLSKYENRDDNYINEEYKKYASIFNVKEKTKYIEDINVAIISPSKVIGRYAHSTFNSIFAYLAYSESNFKLKAFDVESEGYEDIKGAITKIEDEGFDYVIAPLTSDGVNSIISVETNLSIYIPTASKRDFSDVNSSKIFFGAIDYLAQLEKLIEFSKDSLAIFYDDSPLGYKINSLTKSIVGDHNIVLDYSTNSKHTNFKVLKKSRSKLKDSTIILNTPVVSSGLVMSQMTFYDVSNSNILSTQINYDPILLNITQYKDRKNLLIANSIDDKNPFLIEINRLLYNDIEFDWINYSSMIGIDLLYSKLHGKMRYFDEDIVDNSVQYPIKIVAPTTIKLYRNFDFINSFVV